LLGVASPASAQTCRCGSEGHVGVGYGTLRNVNSGLCLGVAAAQIQPGQPIIQWPCNGDPDQYWHMEKAGGVTEIWNYLNNGYCLKDPAPGTGAQLVLDLCDYMGVPADNSFWWAQEIQSTLSSVGYDFVLNACTSANCSGTNATSDVAAVSVASLDPAASIIGWPDQVVGCFPFYAQGTPNCRYVHMEQQWIYYYQIENCC
jgi:hypothetical protein